METMQVRRDIPTDVVLYHILPRLPITSLKRFRSVCKQWYSFLKTRTFANIQSHHVTIGDHQPKPKLLVLSRTTSLWSSTPPEYQFRIIDCEALDDASGDGRPLPFKTNLTYIRILSSLHGLVCVAIGDYDDLVLWNPLTGECKNVIQTNPNMKSHRMALGLYYNTHDDDYKLLVVLSDRSVYIYSLKSNSWRMVNPTDNYQALSGLVYRSWGASTWLNGDLYFLYGGFITRYSIIKFDTKIERFTVIQTHPSLIGLDVKCLSMTVKRGVIHLGVKYVINRDEITYIQLWRMIRDGNWEKVGAPYRADDSMVPLHWIRDKTWLMINYEEGRLCKVDLSKKLHAAIGKRKRETSSCTCIINKGTSHQTVVNYTETFMSLD